MVLIMHKRPPFVMFYKHQRVALPVNVFETYKKQIINNKVAEQIAVTPPKVDAASTCNAETEVEVEVGEHIPSQMTDNVTESSREEDKQSGAAKCRR